MKLIRDTSPSAHDVTVSCYKCGHRVRLSDTMADLDGPAFLAYYCIPGTFHLSTRKACDGCLPEGDN